MQAQGSSFNWKWDLRSWECDIFQIEWVTKNYIIEGYNSKWPCYIYQVFDSSTMYMKSWCCAPLFSERQWNMWIPGYGSDEIRPFKKACTTEAHKQVSKRKICFCWTLKIFPPTLQLLIINLVVVLFLICNGLIKWYNLFSFQRMALIRKTTKK